VRNGAGGVVGICRRGGGTGNRRETFRAHEELVRQVRDHGGRRIINGAEVVAADGDVGFGEAATAGATSGCGSDPSAKLFPGTPRARGRPGPEEEKDGVAALRLWTYLSLRV